MLKCLFCFFIIGIRECKRINIICISHIPFRSLHFFHIIRKSKRQVCCKLRCSVCSCCRFLDQCPFLYNGSSIHVGNVTCSIKSKDSSIQRIFCISILFCYHYLYFLSVISKGCLRENNVHILSCIRQCYCLFLSSIIESCRSLFFLYNICTKIQVFKNGGSIPICCQVLFYQIALAVNFCTIGSFNVCSCIHIINSTFLSAFLILKCCAVLCYICTNQNLTFFVDSKLSQLFFIWNSNGCGLADFQFHIVSCRIDTISCWSCNLFQIYGILRLDDLYGRFTVCISRR